MDVPNAHKYLSSSSSSNRLNGLGNDDVVGFTILIDMYRGLLLPLAGVAGFTSFWLGSIGDEVFGTARCNIWCMGSGNFSVMWWVFTKVGAILFGADVAGVDTNAGAATGATFAMLPPTFAILATWTTLLGTFATCTTLDVVSFRGVIKIFVLCFWTAKLEKRNGYLSFGSWNSKYR